MAGEEIYKRCWAKGLGNCAGTMSKEHVFSQAVSRKGSKSKMSVMGIANMPDGQIGFDGPKARILCQHHNSELSPLDSEAKKLADALHQFVDGAKCTEIHLSGPLIERWALKTVINFMASGFGDSAKWLPSDDLVRVAYGMERMSEGCGLYLLRIDDYQPISTEQTGVTPAWRGSPSGVPEELMGAIVYLHGATFFLLLQKHFLLALATQGLAFCKSNLPLTFDRLTYHPIASQMACTDGRRVIVQYDWAA